MKQTIQYQRAGIFRRICSMIFDVIILLFIFIIVDVFVVAPIVEKSSNFSALNQEYKDTCMSTKLFDYSSDDSGTIVITQKSSNLLEFYKTNDIGYTTDDYNKFMSTQTYTLNGKDYSLYKLDESTGFYVDNVIEDETVNAELTKARYTVVYNQAGKLYNEYLNNAKHADFKALTNKLSNLVLLSYYISLVIGSVITYFVFPMIFKDRTTLGKKMFHFKLIDLRTGQAASRFQVFARFIYFALTCVALGILTYGVAPIISMLIIVVTKKRQTLHDLIAKTAVVSIIEKDNLSDDDIITIEYDDGLPEEETEDLVIENEVPGDEYGK